MNKFVIGDLKIAKLAPLEIMPRALNYLGPALSLRQQFWCKFAYSVTQAVKTYWLSTESFMFVWKENKDQTLTEMAFINKMWSLCKNALFFRGGTYTEAIKLIKLLLQWVLSHKPGYCLKQWLHLKTIA